MLNVQVDRGVIRVQIPDADVVFLMGDFNRWSSCATRMRQIGRDTWEARLAADPLRPEVCFCIWERSALAPVFRRATLPDAAADPLSLAPTPVAG